MEILSLVGVHQISIGSVNGFKSYSDLKILQTFKMAACDAILDFSKIWKMEIIALVGVKTATKFQLDRSQGSKITAISKKF
jgi:hypothetical protein